MFASELDSGRAFRVELGFKPGSGRDFQIILGFFRADIQHVSTKYFSSFFKIIFLFFSESVFCSKRSFGLFFFILQ